jgi:hypothetical protein
MPLKLGEGSVSGVPSREGLGTAGWGKLGRIEAEVRRLHGQMEIDRVEARKKHAEADTLEFNNKVKWLRLVLGATKALMVGEEGEEAVIYTAQMTAFLETLEKLTSS